MKFTGERVVPRDMRKNIDTFQQHLTRYVWALQFIGGKTVGDVACGCGYGADLMTNVATDVIGVDLSSEAISYAYDHYPSLDHLIQMDLENPIPLDTPVDVMVSFETIEHLESAPKFFDWVKANTREMIVGSIPIQCSTEFHKVDYSGEEIVALVKRHFKAPQFFYQMDMSIIPLYSIHAQYREGMILFTGGVR